MIRANQRFLFCIAAYGYFILPSLLYAANPSTTTVSVIIPGLVQISGLSDIVLAPADFSNPVTGATTACIYTNTINPLGSYYITAISTNAASGVFRVANGSNFISYDAFWSPTSAPTQTLSLNSGVKTTQQTGGNGSSLTCSGTPNANFSIRFTRQRP
ncbi:hypothetical protein [Legionella septentrionalis]|uniref:DUF4402 domain-containing protein n=1 Tax=Legionella septentrionalis TaxID=2498109 RepID=A0A3S0X335_9GAMM|nr:hypothetical protein [Legionella septentrionalis]RUQ81534.1 hypothetical protein EKM59_10330 [Legionella septentrionalis]RUR11873.1 hypothetical protein ELY14_01110 [Legionella septentrionalis]